MFGEPNISTKTFYSALRRHKLRAAGPIKSGSEQHLTYGVWHVVYHLRLSSAASTPARAPGCAAVVAPRCPARRRSVFPFTCQHSRENFRNRPSIAPPQRQAKRPWLRDRRWCKEQARFVLSVCFKYLEPLSHGRPTSRQLFFEETMLTKPVVELGLGA